MKLLLHACCGPCSLMPSKLLAAEGCEPTLFYSNSNIHPPDEYARRLSTLRRWADGAGVPVVEDAYDPQAWERTAGLVGQRALDEAAAQRADGDAAPGDDAPGAAACPAVDPEMHRARCRACYRLRLERAAAFAAREGFEGLSTTLTVSPYQYTDVIGEELARAAAPFGLAVVFRDFRPFYDEATRESRALGMYRQSYCGCRFSQQEAAAERAQRKAARAAEREAYRAEHAEELAAEQADRARRAQQRAEYDAKQARKRAVLKALREQNRRQEES